jgi:hypothetical protein
MKPRRMEVDEKYIADRKHFPNAPDETGSDQADEDVDDEISGHGISPRLRWGHDESREAQ